MKPEDYLDLMHTLEGLKNVTRHSWTSDGHHESVAEHSWRLAAMALFLRGEFPDADMDKVLRMCLVHDLGEIFTGDIPSFDKTAADTAREDDLLAAWVASLPEPTRTELAELYREMDARETTEAKIYRALDGFEAVIQHNEADLSTWTELERSLNLTYADDRTAFSPWLTALRAAMREETERKLAEK